MPTPALRVTVGGSADSMQGVPVNYDQEPIDLKTSHFEGRITVRVKDFRGHAAGKKVLAEPQSGYFEHTVGLTWSIALQGRFLESVSVDDLMFGNTFDKPIRDSLPYGTAAALKAVHYIDPSLEQDLYADKPWAWSPLVATMNFVHIRKVDNTKAELQPWTTKQPDEDVTALFENADKDPAIAKLRGDPAARRHYFANQSHRQATKLGPKTEIFADFCNGFINFSNLSLKIPIANIEINLAKYWDGQPVRYVCRTRDGSREFFRLEFILVDTDLVESKMKEGHDVSGAKEAVDSLDSEID